MKRVFAPIHLPTNDVIDQRTDKDQREETPVPPTVKDVADDNQESVLQVEPFLSYKPVEKEYYWQENPKRN